MTSKYQEMLAKLRKDLDAAVNELIFSFAEEVPENSPVYYELREDIINALRTGS
ncbi:MAG: hypothetical protein J5864_09825 [Oscillospiraceae bacterium]|nr:hypothetical protein [Oscillospiraceae bacterium]